MSETADAPKRQTAKKSPPKRSIMEDPATAILERISDGFVALNREWRYTYVNRAAERMAHRKREELLGRIVWDVFPEIVSTRIEDELRRAMNEDTSVHFEEYYARFNAWFDVSVYPSDEGITLYARGVTERRQAEERMLESEARFRAAFEQANIGIVHTSFDGQVLVPNPGFCKFIGYTEDEERRLTIRDMMHPGDYEAEIELTRRLVAGEIPGYLIEKRYIRKDSRLVWGR